MLVVHSQLSSEKILRSQSRIILQRCFFIEQVIAPSQPRMKYLFQEDLFRDSSSSKPSILMQNQDILLQVCSRSDNATLELLSHTSLWPEIKKISRTQYFWYLRTQHLLERELTWRTNGSWKTTYYLFTSVVQGEDTFFHKVLSDELSMIVLLEIEYSSIVNNNYAIGYASSQGYIEAMKFLLADTSTDPSVNNNDAIRHSSEYGYVEIVKLLLADKRVDPSAGNNYAIGYASKNGHTEVVKLLLEDERVDPSSVDNDAIKVASENGHIEIVKLLLADKRVDPYNNHALRLALHNRHSEIAKLLLQARRTR